MHHLSSKNVVNTLKKCGGYLRFTLKKCGEYPKKVWWIVDNFQNKSLKIYITETILFTANIQFKNLALYAPFLSNIIAHILHRVGIEPLHNSLYEQLRVYTSNPTISMCYLELIEMIFIQLKNRINVRENEKMCKNTTEYTNILLINKQNRENVNKFVNSVFSVLFCSQLKQVGKSKSETTF